MDDPAASELEAIVSRFAVAGRFAGADVLESGHINRTYRVSFDDRGRRRRFVVQRINDVVFPDPLAVMRNVERVTRHINDKVLRTGHDHGGQTLHLHPARDGRSWVEGPGGGIWRCYNFIEGCRTHDEADSPGLAREAARAFGAFQHLVSDLPAGEIETVLPGFHDTRKRLAALEAAVSRDACGRLAGVAAEVDFVRCRADECSRLMEGLESGRLAWRIIHNDTKVNNVMIDESSGLAACVIDLDTVMPGSAVFDFGDLVRSAAFGAAEDERDLDRVTLDGGLFRGLVEGYLSSAGDFLTAGEVGELVFAGKLITLEVAMRFLADHLDGDRYFRIHHDGHNLDRARNQIQRVREIEAREDELGEVVEKCRVESRK